MENNYLAHHGILGMKWGVRRYQNEDGSLTPAGRERYQKGLAKEVAGKMQKRESIYDSDVTRNIASKSNTLSKLVKSYKEAGQYANSVINRANKDSVYAKTISEKVKNRWLDRYKAEGKSEQELADEKKYWESGEWLGSMDDTNAVLLSDKEYSKIVDSQTKLQNEWEEEYPKLVNDALGKHGSEKVKIQPEYGKAYNDTVSDYVNGQLRYLGIDLSADKDLEEKILGHSLDSDDHLEHHGILGMKWYRRRFQNEDGSLTPAGRERYGVGEAREGSSDKPKKPGIVERHKQKKEEKRKAAEKAARVKRMQEGKARKAEEKKSAEEHEAAKQKALRSAKASEIMKYRDELTDQEMKDAVARIGWDEALRKKAKEENPDKLTKAMKVVDKYGKAAGSIATATENTTKMYNNIAKALNTFTGSDWPLVGDSKKDQNSSDKGNDKPNNKPNNKPNEGKPSKKDKENFEKTMKEAAKILGEAAKKVDEEPKKQDEDKPTSNGSSSSSSSDKSVFDTKFEYSDAKADRAEQIGRDAVEKYLQLEDKRKG